MSERWQRFTQNVKANTAVFIGGSATALVSGTSVFTESQLFQIPELPAYSEPYSPEDNTYLPIIINPPHSPTPIHTPQPSGCSGMESYVINNREDGVIGPFPPLENGSIFTLESPHSGKVKYLHGPNDNPINLNDMENTPFDLDGRWYIDPSGHCSFEQVQQEYENNPDYTGKTWDELCHEEYITCPAPPPTPTPSPSPTPIPEVCPDDQVQAQILTKDPSSYHRVEPQPSGIVALIWTDRDIDPPWGTVEIKVWIGPEQPTWYFYDAGGTLLYSSTCSVEQMQALFKGKPQNEVMWDDLCREDITCQP